MTNKMAGIVELDKEKLCTGLNYESLFIFSFNEEYFNAGSFSINKWRD